MSQYFRFDNELKEYVLEHEKKARRYVFDPVSDSYIENIATIRKEEYLHEKYGHYGFHDFYVVLKEMMKEELPWIEDNNYRFIHIGDYSFDDEIELSNQDKKIIYSPYAIFVLSQSEEDTIAQFIELCKRLLQ